MQTTIIYRIEIWREQNTKIRKKLSIEREKCDQPISNAFIFTSQCAYAMPFTFYLFNKILAGRNVVCIPPEGIFNLVLRITDCLYYIVVVYQKRFTYRYSFHAEQKNIKKISVKQHETKKNVFFLF